jgi:ribosomal protein L11 methylase PrmA
VPTPAHIVDEMAKLAKVGKNDVVYDLGCGDGVMLIRPIELFGARKGVGIEIDPKILAKAKENVKKAKLEDRIELRLGDLLNVEDVSEASVILLYIGDDLGELLRPILEKNCKPGTRIVSHRFSLGNWQPTRSIKVTNADGEIYDLHLWIVGKK